jgi:hypothetical protein
LVVGFIPSSWAARRIGSQNAVIQQCQVHKKPNVKAHVPEKHWPELDRRLGTAYQESDYEAAKQSLEGTAWRRILGILCDDAIKVEFVKAEARTKRAGASSRGEGAGAGTAVASILERTLTE